MAAVVLSCGVLAPAVDPPWPGAIYACRVTRASRREGSLRTDLFLGLKKVLEQDLLRGAPPTATQVARFEEIRSTLEAAVLAYLREVRPDSLRATGAASRARQAFVQALVTKNGEPTPSFDKAFEWMLEQPALVAAALVDHHQRTLQDRARELCEKYEGGD